jgi:hypothetical protein
MLASIALWVIGLQSPVGAVRPPQRFPFDLAHRFPRADLVDALPGKRLFSVAVKDLGFEQAYDAFGRCVIIGTTDGSDGEIDLGLGQSLGIFDRQVLRSTVGMVDQASVIWRFSLPDRLIQCVHCRAGDLQSKSAGRGGRTWSSWMWTRAMPLPERDLRANHAGLRSAVRRHRSSSH